MLNIRQSASSFGKQMLTQSEGSLADKYLAWTGYGRLYGVLQLYSMVVG